MREGVAPARAFHSETEYGMESSLKAGVICGRDRINDGCG